MSRDEARRKVLEWGDKHGNWFSDELCDDGLVNHVSIDGTFDFEALLDALEIPVYPDGEKVYEPMADYCRNPPPGTWVMRESRKVKAERIR
jgi:hypothetical protein